MVGPAMTDPITQDLYILQNEHGCIKIGRSVNVEQRVAQLRKSERCKIEIVDVYRECGDMEEDLHIDLDDFRIIGEWFLGTDEARTAIHEVMGDDDLPFEWPFAFDLAATEKWVDELDRVRDAASVKRELLREIGILRTATEPCWSLDGRIFGVKDYAETGGRCHQRPARTKGTKNYEWFDPEAGTSGIIPSYTSDIASALLVWPEDIRPATWEGSPIECCIAGLAAIRARLPKPEFK